MSVVVWIVLGLLAGFIADNFVTKTREGLMLNIGIAIGGAVIGGWVFEALGSPDVAGSNVWSALVSVGGAVLFLISYHAPKERLQVSPSDI